MTAASKSSFVGWWTVKIASSQAIPRLVSRWLPHGKLEGNEWTATNPTRSDGRPGSFKINLKSGVWADFSSGDKGSAETLATTAVTKNLKTIVSCDPVAAGSDACAKTFIDEFGKLIDQIYLGNYCVPQGIDGRIVGMLQRVDR